ncbi:MAG: hypothetical protein IT446_01265 [Phycisphaerales bacterium]|nr:hypothetical protein [Phycisphaerales bacterium]
MAKKTKNERNYVSPNHRTTPPKLGDIVAENDSELVQNYVNRQKYVDRALDLNDPAVFFVAPKGVGKSAILQMVRLLRSKDQHRIINISPDNLAFSALANVNASTPLLSEPQRQQHLFRTLWDYVLIIEILSHEHASSGGMVDWIASLFADKDSKDARRLLKITLDDQGNGHTFTERILQLVKEVELSGDAVGGGVAGKVVLHNANTAGTQQLQLLSLVNAVARKLPGRVSHRYQVLIDDLDQDWNGTPLQNAFIAALFQSLRKLNSPAIRFAVSMRQAIYRDLELPDRDKLRPAVIPVTWDRSDVKQMIQKRIVSALNCRESDVWTSVFDPAAFDRIWLHTSGTPRELIRIAEMSLDNAFSSHHKRVLDDDVSKAIRTFSQERIEDLESDWSFKYRGMGYLVKFLNGWPKEFPEKKFEDLAVAVASAIEEKKPGSERYSWANGFLEDYHELINVFFRCGVLQLKLSRTDEPRPYNPDGSEELPPDFWLAIHPMYAPALGLVGA